MLDTILQIFEKNIGAFVSGEDLSKQLGCSRTAVWKGIRSLRAQGYVFEASSRKGYRLVQVPAKLDIPTLLGKLETESMGRSIHYYDEVDSTQTIAKQKVAEGAPEGTIVIAESQTAGRGRMGRKWYSPKGKGIWMSVVLKPQIPIHFAPQLTLLTAVALCRTIRRECKVDIGIKWPNDLLINGKKVCGILLESSAEDERIKHVICGVGISANLGEEDYPPELLDIATSLAIASGEQVYRETLIASFLQELEQLYKLYHQEGFATIRALWEALSVTLHRPIQIHTPRDGIVEGIASGIDESGGLRIVSSTGEQLCIFSGDVELYGKKDDTLTQS
ncbi:biotin--[acetyl-CoA-carboxylase] ligase [Paenibacillus sp. N1-5-1-14]|uniref:biotin--[acetyl-CoA-carboxylase] ligase n=1 Tax=Paenibacillus radicibacter TaxID=2972488 RepID=UPI0021595F2C|nr:biotin--[acetyl-CoA-carboxylase] ligase [Paenibacillus radicibacter]MCR8642251.1 biotin--[acetyl-CoA-carboxylase] ligase [Paenibacillus radicibacter]